MHSKPILLVEDNADDEVLALRAFSKSNISNPIVVARDGAEALDYLFAQGQYADRDSRDLPAVVLLDLKLPKIDGLEVLRQIRGNEQTRMMPVVILTSSRQDEDLVSGYNLGANSYVRKPVDFIEFVAAVGQLGIYWLLLNELPY
jgi:two-component system response regulator